MNCTRVLPDGDCLTPNVESASSCEDCRLPEHERSADESSTTPPVLDDWIKFMVERFGFGRSPLITPFSRLAPSLQSPVNTDRVYTRSVDCVIRKDRIGRHTQGTQVQQDINNQRVNFGR